MAPVVVRTYDTIRLPGSARDSRILVAAVGQTINRDKLQLLRQQFVTDASYTPAAGVWVGGANITQPATTGGSTPYSLHDPGHDMPVANAKKGARPNQGVGAPEEWSAVSEDDPRVVEAKKALEASKGEQKDEAPKARRGHPAASND